MKRLLYILCLMAFISCNKQTETKQTTKVTETGIPVISISCEKNQVLNLSEFADSIEIIPLETNDECLIGWIPKIIATRNHYLLISAIGYDFQKLYVFDKQGNFIRQISSRGQGGEEFYEVRNFDVIGDSIIKMADVYVTRTFNMEGKMLASKRTTSHGQVEIIHSHEKTFCFEGGSVGENGNNLLFVLDSTDTRIEELVEVPPFATRISRHFGNFNNLTKDDKYVYFYHPYSVEIYQIDPIIMEYKQAYQMDYGNKTFTWDMFDNENGTIEDWSDQRKKNTNLMALTELQSIGNHFIISSALSTSEDPYGGCISLYSTRTGKVMTGQIIKDDMFFKGHQIKLKPRPGGTLSPHGNDDGHLLWVLTPKILLKGYESYRKVLGESKWNLFCKKYPRLTEICEQLDEDSNPILLKIKLKEF